MSARQTNDVFDLAFDKFKKAHESILDLDRRKLLPAKAAGEALMAMRQNKGCTIDQLLDTLQGLGINISQDTHNRYVRVASRWDEMVAIAKRRSIDLETLGYVEALDLLPLSEHALRVKASKQKTKVAMDSGSAPQEPNEFHGDGQPEPFENTEPTNDGTADEDNITGHVLSFRTNKGLNKQPSDIETLEQAEDEAIRAFRQALRQETPLTRATAIRNALRLLLADLKEHGREEIAELEPSLDQIRDLVEAIKEVIHEQVVAL